MHYIWRHCKKRETSSILNNILWDFDSIVVPPYVITTHEQQESEISKSVFHVMQPQERCRHVTPQWVSLLSIPCSWENILSPIRHHLTVLNRDWEEMRRLFSFPEDERRRLCERLLWEKTHDGSGIIDCQGRKYSLLDDVRDIKSHVPLMSRFSLKKSFRSARTNRKQSFSWLPQLSTLFSLEPAQVICLHHSTASVASVIMLWNGLPYFEDICLKSHILSNVWGVRYEDGRVLRK